MNPFLQARLSAFTLMTMLLGFCLTISAQVDQEAKTAEALKPNVIGIKSTFANGSQARGFGTPLWKTNQGCGRPACFHRGNASHR